MGTLLSITLKLLKERSTDISYTDISKATGLSIYWLANLNRNGKRTAKTPDVNKVQKLYEYLSKRELKLD